ncbi:MAG: Nif3-like dinuclear metal center hexameric protein, partial [Lachnospirales bacterium]
VGYHDAQVAEDNNICLIDGTHYLTEVIVVPEICKYISDNFNGVVCVCSKINGQTLKIV